MSCGFNEDVTAYADRELPEPRRAQLEQHLPGCAECRTTWSLVQRTIEQVATLPAFESEPSASAAMRRAVMNRLDEPPSVLERLRMLLRPVVLVPSVGLLGAALVAVVLARPHRQRLGMIGSEDPAAQLELAADMELVEDYEVLGMNSADDVEVVEHLRELEGTP